MLEGQLMAINLCNTMLYDLSFVVVVAFSEREPFLRGFLCGKCGKFLPQMCIWVTQLLVGRVEVHRL